MGGRLGQPGARGSPRAALAVLLAVMPALARCAPPQPETAFPGDRRPGALVARAAASADGNAEPSPPPCPPGDQSVPVLRVGFPHHGVPSMKEPRALSDLLTERVGTPVRIETRGDYRELTRGLADGTLDAAMLPPLEYVRARDRDPCIDALLTQVVEGRARYSAYLVVRKDSGLTDPRQLAGRHVAFVSQDSASGWLLAVSRLMDAGIDPRRDTAGVRFLGTHRAVLQAVLDGTSDAGATYPGALEAARRDGLDTAALTLLSIGGRIPYDALVVRPGLDATQARSLVDALASVNTLTPDGRQALSFLQGANGWIPTTDAFYDDVRDVERRVRSLGGDLP